MQSTGGTRATADNVHGAAPPRAAAHWGAAGSVATADARDPTSHHDRCRDGWWGCHAGAPPPAPNARGGGRDWVVARRAEPPNRRRGCGGEGNSWAPPRPGEPGSMQHLVGFQGRKKVEKCRQENSRSPEHRQRFTITMRCVSLRLFIARVRDTTRRFSALDQSAGCFPARVVQGSAVASWRIEVDGRFVSKANSFDTTRPADHRRRTACRSEST